MATSDFVAFGLEPRGSSSRNPCYLRIYLSVYLSIYLPFFWMPLSIYLSTHPSIDLSIYPAIYPSIRLSIDPSVCPSVDLSIAPIIYFSASLRMDVRMDGWTDGRTK